MEKVELFKNKKDCCGCGACMNICSKSAIVMEEDEYGFTYPKIQEEKCISCHACEKVCAYQHREEEKMPVSVWAAARSDSDKILQSASGGIFAVLAEQILKEGGVVFGVSMEYEDEKLVPRHIMIEEVSQLIKLQGSKYVQSAMGDTYKIVEQQLLSGRKVLFSGTPCQIAGLNEYMRKSYENLLTVDIICHGVPNMGFFQSYIKTLEDSINEKIMDFKFRDKSQGWGLNSKVIYRTTGGEIKEKFISCSKSSYFQLFLDSKTYRENCYSCRYTNEHRPGDITLGDYWGIQKEHPELLENTGGRLSDQKGISVVIVSSEKGEQYLKECNYHLNSFESTYAKAARKNDQLRNPSKRSSEREKILDLFSQQGYQAVEQYYQKQYRIKLIKSKIKRFIPSKIKSLIKKVI